MSGMEKKAVVSLLYDLVNNREIDKIRMILADDFRYNAPPGVPSDGEGLVRALQDLLCIFPDFQVTVKDVAVEGDMVAVRVEGRGTQKGFYAGLPPTDKQVSSVGMDVYEVKTGKIARAWHYADSLACLTQLGIISLS